MGYLIVLSLHFFFSLFKIGVGFQSFDLGFWFNSIVVTKKQSFCDFNPVKSAIYLMY